MTRLALSPDEQRVLVMTLPYQALQRPAFRGHAFRLAGEVTGSFRSRCQFPEDLVMAMIGRGLLYVAQCARDLPVRDTEGRTTGTTDRPFSVILSREGERQRAYLLQDRRDRGANDNGNMERVA